MASSRTTGRPSSFVECCGIALQLDRRQLKEGERRERTTPSPAMGTNLSSLPQLKISRISTRRKTALAKQACFLCGLDAVVSRRGEGDLDKGRVVAAGWGGHWWSGKPRQGTGDHLALAPAETITKVLKPGQMLPLLPPSDGSSHCQPCKQCVISQSLWFWLQWSVKLKSRQW